MPWLGAVIVVVLTIQPQQGQISGGTWIMDVENVESFIESCFYMVIIYRKKELRSTALKACQQYHYSMSSYQSLAKEHVAKCTAHIS